MLNVFDGLPDEADCWIYAADRTLSSDEADLLTALFDTFQQDWSSHGRKVAGACVVVDRRIVIVAAHVADGDISGCGIDKSLHLLQEVADSRSFNWASALNIVYKDAAGDIEVVPRRQFKVLAEEGRIDAETRVVDLSIRQLGALRSGGIMRPAGSSWHARLLPSTEPAL